MTAPIVAFFNNKGGVGKTSLVHHLAFMVARKGLTVIAADLDPQANLTSNFLTEDALETLWPTDNGLNSPGRTVYGSLSPFINGEGSIGPAPLVPISDGLHLLPGDLALSKFEDDLSSEWPRCLDGKARAFRVISSFWRLLSDGAAATQAELVLVDVGPNLGAINRAALIAADHVVIPLAPDLFSVQGLQNLGPTLRAWRGEWQSRVSKNPAADLTLPSGKMQPSGYVLLGHGVRLGQPVKAYQRWLAKIPEVYRTSVLGIDEPAPTIADDPYCLAQLKHYRSLMPLAQETHKPIFDLKPADGAFGGHQAAVTAARADFSILADRILAEIGISAPAHRASVT